MKKIILIVLLGIVISFSGSDKVFGQAPSNPFDQSSSANYCNSATGTKYPNSPKIYPADAVSFGNDNLCQHGNPTPAYVQFPERGKTVSWTCKNQNGTVEMQCYAKRNDVVIINSTPKAITSTPTPTPTPTPTFSCTGDVSGNSVMCLGDDQGLTANFAKILVSSCTNVRKCEYVCKTGYTFKESDDPKIPEGRSCVANTVITNTTNNNPQCGTANGKIYEKINNSFGDDTLCANGIASPLNPVFPKEGKTTEWKCSKKANLSFWESIFSKDIVSCSAGRKGLTNISGCGTAAGEYPEDSIAFRSNNFCQSGYKNPTTTPIFPIEKGTSVEWKCSAGFFDRIFRGKTDVICSATKSIKTYECSGDVPNNGIKCEGDENGVITPQSWTLAGNYSSSCTGGKKCEYYIPQADFHYNNFFIHGPAHKGDIGGIEGANKLCLDAINAKHFVGRHKTKYSQDEVYAFLCDSKKCNNLKPDTKYGFAVLGYKFGGEGSFTTDSVGRGPGNNDSWADSGGPDSSPERFDSFSYWIGPRKLVNDTLWGLESTGYYYSESSCLDWTVRGSKQKGNIGSSPSKSSLRWSSPHSSPCSNYLSLICVVEENMDDCAGDNCKYNGELIPPKSRSFYDDLTSCQTDMYGRMYNSMGWPYQDCRGLMMYRDSGPYKLNQEDVNFLNSATLMKNGKVVEKDSRGHFFLTRTGGGWGVDPQGYSVGRLYSAATGIYSYNTWMERAKSYGVHIASENMIFDNQGSYYLGDSFIGSALPVYFFGETSADILRIQLKGEGITGLENAPDGAVKFLYQERHNIFPPPTKNACYCEVSDYSVFSSGAVFSQYNANNQGASTSMMHGDDYRFSGTNVGGVGGAQGSKNKSYENYWNAGCYYAEGENSTIHIEGFRSGVASEGTFSCSGEWWVEPYSWTVNCSAGLKWVDGPKAMDEKNLDCWKRGPNTLILPPEDPSGLLPYFKPLFTKNDIPEFPFFDSKNAIRVGADYCTRTYTGINGALDYCGINKNSQPYREKTYCRSRWNLDPCAGEKFCKAGWNSNMMSVPPSVKLDADCVPMLGGSSLNLVGMNLTKRVYGYNNTVEFCGLNKNGKTSHITLKCDGVWAIEASSGKYYCQNKWIREEYGSSVGC